MSQQHSSIFFLACLPACLLTCFISLFHSWHSLWLLSRCTHICLSCHRWTWLSFWSNRWCTCNDPGPHFHRLHQFSTCTSVYTTRLPASWQMVLRDVPLYLRLQWTYVVALAHLLYFLIWQERLLYRVTTCAPVYALPIFLLLIYYTTYLFYIALIYYYYYWELVGKLAVLLGYCRVRRRAYTTDMDRCLNLYYSSFPNIKCDKWCRLSTQPQHFYKRPEQLSIFATLRRNNKYWDMAVTAVHAGRRKYELWCWLLITCISNHHAYF